MAYAFKSVVAHPATSSFVSYYDAPSAGQGVVVGFLVANTTGSTATVSIKIGATESTATVIASSIDIPANTTLSPIDGKLILNANEDIWISVSPTSSCDVHISVIEFT